MARNKIIDAKKLAAAAEPVDFKAVPCDRLRCQFAMVHDHCGDPPTQVQSVFADILKTQEQPYCRRVQLDEDWQQLDLGWVKNPGYIVIENKEGKAFYKNQTPEEIEMLDKKIVVLGFKCGDVVCPAQRIRPSRLIVFELDPAASPMVRAARDRINIAITVFPR